MTARNIVETGLVANDVPHEIPLITKERSSGPVTTRRRRRSLAVWVALCLVGIVPTLAQGPVWLRTLGYGLWLPGGGFLADDGWLLLAFAGTLVLFGVSMAAWLLTGNAVAPVIVWLGSAGVAAAAAGQDLGSTGQVLVVVLAALVLAAGLANSQVNERSRHQRRAERNAAMPAAFELLRSVANAVPSTADRELGVDDLAALRGLFDLALQPVGELAGFDKIDTRFQPAALRYQLNKIQHALSVAQCQYTPSFHGYLNQAQRFTIESLTLPEVCGYWMLESAWGHGRFHADPIDTKDNVMMTGWSGQCLGTYAANTGDLRYGDDDALKFRPFKRHPDKSYAHTHHDFVASLRQNWARAPYCLFPCEPNFAYMVCNLYGYGGAVAYDRAYGTNYAAEVHDRFHRNLHNEFELADGELQPILSVWTGLTFIFKPTLVSAFTIINLMNVLEPEFAQRTYAVWRHEALGKAADGRLVTGKLAKQDQMDVGNYKASTAFTLAWIAASARELGDDDMAELTLAELDLTQTRTGTPGVLAYEGVSTLTSADIVLGRILRKDYWRDTVVTGPAKNVLTGPLLADCAYPDVLVARATSHTGSDLDLVLYPGAKPGSEQVIVLDRLRPGARYAATGVQEQQFVADHAGRARLTVRLGGRTAVTVRPA